tara:strand:+ start:18861 stop:19073 length:213 start_codon:yes stop_codon:yes gene_type:complete
MFNLKQYRTAYYEDGRGLMQNQSRSWMNCYKVKVEGGMKPQAAWDSCLKDYQNLDDGKWAIKYASKKSKK